MTDFLQKTLKDIEARRRELAPLVEEYRQLEEAAAALQGVDGGSTRKVGRPAAVAQGPPEPAVAAVRVAPASVPSRRSTWSPASPGSRSPSSPRR